MAEYFIKKGSEYYTAQDIYDKRGMLLLSKGQKITAEVKNRLERLGKVDQEKSSDADNIQNVLLAQNDRQSTVLTPVTKEFVERMSIRDSRILEKPNDILINIIFESKTKPWWIYVNALSNYVDWLYTHSIDVAVVSLMMAVELGYSDEELTNLGIGAMLHDVGKLLVPKSIIQKPEKLTDSEMSLVRQHCELGMSSLESFNLPKEYMDIVMQHHERLDGSGYPKGLKGDEISRNSRIVMIADAVDAITSYRPYRQSQSMDVAINKLRNEKEKYPQELISLLEKILQ
ncbi:HD-GYP domain-containing protein [Desulfoscipio gibsoniae]|uniref:Putative domain HDIG-containing protein n=1 Tax=Desulfoscipio gibsoniae DSM 7213 TaxID=767817 RepID=R4KMR6_9FIRM|nr:HD domain-containing phosphohydrolase [Desulfoscipio gibsoniae]AGL02857.1 putative domain HDIG-containing protein [Desulfoscipio gibsoniae DSM 7213]